MLDPKFKPKKLSRFLWGGLFTVVTDLEHLHGLFQKQEFATKRQEKMVLSMLEFDFTLGYKPGKLMIFPDALSRVPATVAGIVKTVIQEKGRLFFEEAHIVLGKHNGYTETLSRMKDVFWNTKHYDIRSWMSMFGCSFAKDCTRRQKRYS